MEIGISHTSSLLVTQEKTAIAAGSGDMPVLATPFLLALMENAAMMAVAQSLDEGCTTVGGHIESSHLIPTPVGKTVSASATLTKIDGRKLFFDVVATDGDQILGKGTHLRFIVGREKFLSKLK